MNREELLCQIKALESKKDGHMQSIQSLDESIGKLNNALIDGIHFVPNELLYAVAYFMTLKNSELYVPTIESIEAAGYDSINGICKYYSTGYVHIAGLKERDIVVYDHIKSQNLMDLDLKHNLSYDFLNERIGNYPIVTTKNNLDEHENIDRYQHIRDYICYLADMQIEKNRHLYVSEMYNAAHDFLELEKDKPKQKIKKPNNKES